VISILRHTPTLPNARVTTSVPQLLSVHLAILYLLLKELVLWQKRVVRFCTVKSTPTSFYFVTYIVTSPIPSMNQPPIIHYRLRVSIKFYIIFYLIGQAPPAHSNSDKLSPLSMFFISFILEILFSYSSLEISSYGACSKPCSECNKKLTVFSDFS